MKITRLALFGLLSLVAAVFIGKVYGVQAFDCPSGDTCAWVDVSNVYNYGVPYSKYTQNFYNDATTANHLCQMSGYDTWNGDATLGKYDKCNTEYDIVWDGVNNKWSGFKCVSSKWFSTIQCAKANPAPPPAVPTVSLSASPASMAWYGGGVTLAWTAANADSCSAGGDWSGFKDANGGNETDTVWPFASDKTYTILCTGPGGSASDSVTVPVGATTDMCPNIDGVQTSVPDGMTVDSSGNCVTPSAPTPAPTVSISADPSSLGWSGGSVNINWSATDADSCYAGGDWSGSKDPSGGSESVYIWPFSSDKTYTLLCSGAGGSGSGSVTVSVGSVSEPPPATPPSATLALSTACAAPGSSVEFTSDAEGSPISSNAIEEDAGSGYNTLTTFGTPSGAQHFFDTFASGSYSFRTNVDNGVYSPVQSLTVSDSCGGGGGGGIGGPTGGGDSGGGSGGTGGPAMSPSFTISASPSVIDVKSLAGYSGVAQQVVDISVNPVSGFTDPVTVSVDQSSIPADIKPEFSFGGGDFAANPTAVLTFDGEFFRSNGLIYLPIQIKIDGAAKTDESYPITFTATSASGVTSTAQVTVVSEPLNPNFQEQ